jgi:hypothetical protein
LFPDEQTSLLNKLNNWLISHSRINHKGLVFSVCVMLSVVFWLVTSLSRSYESSLVVPVRYENFPLNRNVEDDLPSHLEFMYQGTGFELMGIYLRKKPDSIVVDIGKAISKNGRINLPSITLRNQIPGDLKAQKVLPEYISPGVTVRRGKRVPVTLTIERFQFRERFAPLGKTVLIPDSVDVAGPDDILRQIHSVPTMPVNVTDIHSDYFAGVHMDTRLPEGVRISPAYIHFYVPVEEFTEAIAEIPVHPPPALPKNAELIPAMVKVIYQVPLSRFETINSADFTAVAEFSDNELTGPLQVRVTRSPFHARDIRLDPPFVDYLYRE